MKFEFKNIIGDDKLPIVVDYPPNEIENVKVDITQHSQDLKDAIDCWAGPATPIMPRYFMDRDDSGHWYVISENNKEQWNKWLGLDSDLEEAWNVPEFAREIGGNPANVTFENPKF